MSQNLCSNKLILLDDDEAFCQVLASSLTRHGMAVSAFHSLSELNNFIDESTVNYDYAVLDLRLADGLGTTCIKKLRNKFPSAQIIVLTGYGSIANAVQAVQDGANDYLTKPIDTDKLLKVLKHQTKELSKPAIASLEKVEWEHIQRVLHECEGNISKAARLLGLERRSLQRKLQRLTGS